MIYEFWITYPRDHPGAGLRDRVARCRFSSDTEAIDWFKTNYPAQFEWDAKMRVYGAERHGEIYPLDAHRKPVETFYGEIGNSLVNRQNWLAGNRRSYW